MSRYEQHVSSAGQIGLNPGVKQARIDTSRAVVEAPLNGVNAGGKYTVVDVLPHSFNPLHPKGCQEGDNDHTYTVVTNTYLDPNNYDRALGYGTTRGTCQDLGNQEVGNCLGIGKKEAAWALGGNPGFIGIKHYGNGVYVFTGYVVHDEIMKLNTHLKITENDQMSYVTFELRIELNDVRDTVVNCKLICPFSSTGGREIENAKKMLYCTGMPFCKPGTHYRELDDDYDAAFAENKIRFINTMLHTFWWWRTWRNNKIEEIKRGNVLLDFDELMDSMEVVSISFAHGITANNIVLCDVRRTLNSEFDAYIEGHRWAIRGSTWSLATLIASEINYDYYDKTGRKIWVFVAGCDIRKINVYLPLERIQRSIAIQPPHILQSVESIVGPSHRKSPIDNAFVDYGRVSFCPSVAINERSAIIKVDDQVKSIPHVVWGDNEETCIITWPDWSTAWTRDAPPGIIFTRRGSIVNPLSPGDIFTNPSLFIGMSSIMQRSCQAFGSILAGKKNMMQAEQTISKLCHALGMRTDDPSTDHTLSLSEIEGKCFSNLTLMNNPSCPIPQITVQTIAALTAPVHGFFGEIENNVTPKNVLDQLFGCSAAGIFEVNPDAFGVNPDKTSLRSRNQLGGGSIVGLHAMATRHLAMYAMNCTLKPVHLNRLQKLRDAPYASNMLWPSAADRESKSIAATGKVQLSKHDDDTPLQEWFKKCHDPDIYRPVVGVKTTIHKNSDQLGWSCSWTSRVNSSERRVQDSYFWNPKYADVLVQNSIRSETALVHFQNWVDGGMSMDMDTYTAEMKGVLEKVLNSQTRAVIVRNKTQKLEKVLNSQTMAVIDTTSPTQEEECAFTASSHSSHGKARKTVHQPDFGTRPQDTNIQRFVRKWYDRNPHNDPPYIIKGGNGTRWESDMIDTAVNINENIMTRASNRASMTEKDLRHLDELQAAMLFGMHATLIGRGRVQLKAACVKSGIQFPCPCANWQPDDGEDGEDGEAAARMFTSGKRARTDEHAGSSLNVTELD